MYRTIAFHGQYSTPAALRRDMGDPSFVDYYVETGDPYEVRSVLSKIEPLILIGYSIGGSLIGHLSHLMPNIAAAVLYESPLIGLDRVSGKFPVLWIRNNYRASKKREQEFSHAREVWSGSRPFYEATGVGRHVKWVFGWPPLGHAWDKSLNPQIAQWLRNHC